MESGATNTGTAIPLLKYHLRIRLIDLSVEPKKKQNKKTKKKPQQTQNKTAAC